MKKGWQRKTLGEICQFRGGGTPSKAIEKYWRGDIPWVSPKDVKSEVVSDSIDHISREAIDGSSTSLIPKNSILMVVRSGILARTIPIAITGRDLTINQDLKALCPESSVDSRFLYRLLESKMDLLLSLVSRGATVHRLITEQIRSLDVFLPPLPEQRRIVRILDEAFAAIAAAQAKAEKNLQNARDFLLAYFQSVFSKGHKEWVEKELQDICSFSSGGTPSKSNSSFWKGDIPWISGRDMKSTRLKDGMLHISQMAVNESATRMAPKGSLLILVRGMGLAHGAQIAELLAPCAFNQDIKAVHPAREVVPMYLLLALRYRINSSENVLSKAAHGTLKIDMNELKRVKIPLPPQEEQEQIVKRIDVLTAEAKGLERIYQQKLSALSELKQSLLHQAFSGNL